MTRLIAAEFLKLAKRRLSWVLALIAALFVGLIYIAFLAILAQGDAAATGGTNLDDLREMVTVRNSHVFGFGIAHQAMAVMAIILTATSITGEFNWRTIITMSNWSGDRRWFFVAKLLVICLFVLAGTALCWLAAAGGSIMVESIEGTLSTNGLGLNFLASLGASWIRTSLAVIIYAMAAAALAGVTRSSAISIGLALVALYVEPIGLQLIDLLPLGLDRLEPFLVSPNVNGLLQANGTIEGMGQPGDLPPAPQAAIYVIVVSIASAAAGILAIARRDVDV